VNPLDFFSTASGISKAVDMGMDFTRMNEAGNEAHENRQWQQDMRATQYQTAVADMKKAGLNPMLAYQHGGAGTPGGATASIPSGGGESLSAAEGHVRQGQLATAQQAVQTAQADNVRANTGLLEAQTETERNKPENLRADTALKGGQLGQALAAAQDLLASVQQRGASAAMMNQQIVNMKAELPKIIAATRQLEALTKLNLGQLNQALASAGLHGAEADRVRQQIQAGLPGIERTLQELEIAHRRLQQPGQEQQSILDESFAGTLSRTIKMLNPFGGIVGAIGIGRQPARRTK